MTESTCTSCGAVLDTTGAYCVYCGAPRSDGSLGQPTPVTTPAVAIWDEQCDPDGKTILAEDDVPTPSAVSIAAPEPEVTILEEPEPPALVIRLQINDVESGESQVEFELGEGGSFMVGRDGRVTDYVPEDPRASRRHFSISVAPEGVYLTDLGSSNGTYVNGVRVTDPIWLNDGDSIEYGRSSAVLRVSGSPAGPGTNTSGVLYF